APRPSGRAEKALPAAPLENEGRSSSPWIVAPRAARTLNDPRAGGHWTFVPCGRTLESSRPPGEAMQEPPRGLGLGLARAGGALPVGCAHGRETPAPEQTEERRIAVANGWLLGRSLGLGTATPLVFLHGVGGNHRFFEPQLQGFRNGRRVLAFDQRGCGGS